ncbi:uncharacterized protein LOC131456897 isoform X2 [Solea solea]|uniref:uncharacterized protein LOC131456897 isoform X2 n=1 Tax=Solea solea TaxID=90069 RepID=UPI00272BD8F4|nr:uncharacterized protein LOC131456897 isoform X2 [Solea solea]
MNTRNARGLLEENADLRLQLHQQREEIHHLQNRLHIEIRTNNVLDALQVPHHRYALYSDPLVNHCEGHHEHHEQLLQLEAEFKSELQDAKVKVMDLLRMLQQKDKEMSRMKTDVEAVIRRHKVIVKELQQKEKEWKRKYAALEPGRKCMRDKAYSESYHEVSSTGEEEEEGEEDEEEDVNVEHSRTHLESSVVQHLP